MFCSRFSLDMKVKNELLYTQYIVFSFVVFKILNNARYVKEVYVFWFKNILLFIYKRIT